MNGDARGRDYRCAHLKDGRFRPQRVVDNSSEPASVNAGMPAAQRRGIRFGNSEQRRQAGVCFRQLTFVPATA